MIKKFTETEFFFEVALTFPRLIRDLSLYFAHNLLREGKPARVCYNRKKLLQWPKRSKVAEYNQNRPAPNHPPPLFPVPHTPSPPS